MGLKKYFVKNKAREDIEAEEIFLDAREIRSLEDKGKLEQPIRRRNFFLFYVLIVVCLLILFLRAGYLQVIKGEYYQNLAQGNRLRVYSLPAPRGIIYDRSRRPLVYNVPSFDLVVNLVDFLSNPVETQEEILEKISCLLAGNDFKQKIEQAKNQVSRLVLAKNIERSTALILESSVNDWPGLRLEKNARRQYVLNRCLAHVLGYTGQVDSDDLKEHPDYSLNDQIGKAGLEYYYEDLLRGEPGQEQIEVNSFGQTQSLLATKSARPGQSLVLFINRDLQEKLYQALDKIEKAEKAAAIALDPRNGGILALVSLPGFDSNLFAQGISQTDLFALKNDPNEPFLNRALSGQYPPGSTIKPLIAAGALEEEIIKPEQQINCQGGLSVVNKYDPRIIYYFPDWKAHGLTNIIKAIAQSCNVYFYTVGGELGVERIEKYLQDFGLGQATHIDLPHERVGLIPDEEWKKKVKPDEEWYLGDTYHLSIGQGDILVTPLQMASAIGAIANGGILYQPQVVDKIIGKRDIPAKIIRENFIQPENIKIVQKGMRQAVLNGSARALSDLPVKVAGKTGTAQFGAEGKTHAWFIGYAPYDQPEIVLTVLVEGGGQGHETAVPVAKEVFKWYFGE